MNAVHTYGAVSRLFAPFTARRDETRKAREQRATWWRAEPMPSVDTGSQLRSSLRSEIQQVWESASRKDWNGDGANAVPTTALKEAILLAGMIPESVESPTVSGCPDGSLTFEWYRSSGRQLSLSISGNGVLDYAGVTGDEEPSGQIAFFGDRWPDELNAPLRQLFAP